MEHEALKFEINGQEMTDLYPNLVSLEVELDEALAAMFRLRLALPQQHDGSWNYVDDTRLALWSRVTVRAGFGGSTDEVMQGYITHVKPQFDTDLAACALEIWGMDASVLLNREERRKDWPNKKDSDIAREIFLRYGLTAQVEDTGVVHDETVSTIIQCETDMRFLQRLALRNGYECFVDGGSGYFRSPEIDSAPQPVLAIRFGDDTNLNRIALEAEALSPVSVVVTQLGRSDKQVLDRTIDRGQRRAYGAADAAALLGPGMTPGIAFVGTNGTTGMPEMTALAQGLFDEGQWFVRGEGEIAANRYAHVLRARAPVTIKGVGENFSGVYYVSHVTHCFSSTGYTQRFRVKRNALRPTGTENFARAPGALAAAF
jgi:phage protein D